MKIVSYNINGLRAFNKNGKLDELLTTYPADIYCLQETKASDGDIFRIFDNLRETGWSIFNAVNTIKTGYAGVTTLVSPALLEKIVSVTRDDVDWGNTDLTYIQGRIVNVKFTDFSLINVYVLNSGNKDELRKLWDIKFSEYLKTIDGPYIVCGDFNVCSSELDYHGNYEAAIDSFPGLMRYEINGFEKMLTENNLVDVYRKQHINERAYTWYSTRLKTLDITKGWRIDYFLCTPDMVSKIEKTDIHQGFQGLDHSPIEIDINIPVSKVIDNRIKTELNRIAWQVCYKHKLDGTEKVLNDIKTNVVYIKHIMCMLKSLTKKQKVEYIPGIKVIERMFTELPIEGEIGSRLREMPDWVADVIVEHCDNIIRILDNEENTGIVKLNKKYAHKLLYFEGYESGSNIICIDEINQLSNGNIVWSGTNIKLSTENSSTGPGVLINEVTDAEFEDLPYFTNAYDYEEECEDDPIKYLDYWLADGKYGKSFTGNSDSREISKKNARKAINKTLFYAMYDTTAENIFEEQ